MKEQVNGSPGQRPSITTGGSTSFDLVTNETTTTNLTAVSTAHHVGPNVTQETNSLNKSVEEKIEELVAESLEKILENKLVKGTSNNHYYFSEM